MIYYLRKWEKLVENGRRQGEDKLTAKEALSKLGLDIQASAEEIKKAYKKMAQRYHPDNGETKDQDQFIKITEAYEYLKNRRNEKEEGSYETEQGRQEPCPQCKGRGKRKIKRKTQRGFMVVSKPCETCNGTGFIKG